MLFPIIYRLVVFPEATLKDMWDLYSVTREPTKKQSKLDLHQAPPRVLTLDQLNYKSGMQRQQDTPTCSGEMEPHIRWACASAESSAARKRCRNVLLVGQLTST
jgi:hypothetical protein